MGCCCLCIGDRALSKRAEFRTTSTGRCGYCARENALLVETDTLRDDFEALAGIYSTDANGRPLLAWLKEDWEMFPTEVISAEAAERLLVEILGDPGVATRLMAPSTASRTDSLQRWRDFRYELMHVNRFFPQGAIDLARLKALLPYLQSSSRDQPQIWFRARLQVDDLALTLEQMGAPPKERSSHGRANPAGIPYLYLASDADTAISEIRPHAGEIATVAEFGLVGDLEFLDLRHPRKTVSPFDVSGEAEAALLRADIAFLEQLGDELTRPVVPNSAAINYTPSQYLCELAKHCNFHGVLYRSSVTNGTNLALFQSGLAIGRVTSQLAIRRIRVEAENLAIR